MLLVTAALTIAVQDTGAAGGLVVRAPAARERNERLVTAYTATVTQRVGAGIHALSRDRMLFHQELAANISWRRDGQSRIEVVGARQRVPIASRGAEVPEDLDNQFRWLVLNPGEDYLRLIGTDDEGFVYPLREGSERDYRFAAGDTTVITLPSGRDVRLLELRVTARRPDYRLINGSLWFDADSYGLVRAVFRPARPYEFRRDADSSDREDVPSFLNPTGEVKYITLEYGLYESRWWMLRYAAMDVIATVGSAIGIPFRFERVYTNYRVQGGTPPDPNSTFRPAGTVRRRERSAADSARAEGRPYQPTAADSIRADSVRQAVAECVRLANEAAPAGADSSRQARRAAARARARRCMRRNESDSALVVVIPADTAALLSSPLLGPPILEMGDIISENELSQLGQSIGQLPQRPWEFRPDLPVGVGAVVSRLRYNRVEALSLGWGGAVDFGRLRLDGMGRIGLADREPNVELGLTRPTASARFRLGAYRRLAAANPEVSPFSGLSSAAAFFLGRDDGEYFRSLGVELTGRGSETGWSWRLYAERQDSASVRTSVSVPHLFSRSHVFRPNIAAQPADQAGASVTLRASRTLSHALNVGGDVTLDGATGDFDFGRVAGALRLTITPRGPLAFGAEAEAGTSTGAVPVQSLFYLGGPATLRGYDGGVASGPAFWRGRLEVGNAFPAFRLALFSDAAWAGPRGGFATGRPLLGAGIGASMFDGLLRLDLSRGLRAPTGWRFDIHLDGVI